MEVAGGVASFLSAAIAATQVVEKAMGVDRRHAKKNSTYIVSPKPQPGEHSKAQDQRPRRMPYPPRYPDSKMTPKSIESWWDTLEKASRSKDFHPEDSDLPPTPPNTVYVRGRRPSPSLDAIRPPESTIPQRPGSESVPVGILKTSKSPNLKRLVNRFIGKHDPKLNPQLADTPKATTYSSSVAASSSAESILDGTESYTSATSHLHDATDPGMSLSNNITTSDHIRSTEGTLPMDRIDNEAISAVNKNAAGQDSLLSPEEISKDAYRLHNSVTPDIEWMDPDSSNTLSSTPSKENNRYSTPESPSMHTTLHETEPSDKLNIATGIVDGEISLDKSSGGITSVQEAAYLRHPFEENENQMRSYFASQSDLVDLSFTHEEHSQVKAETPASMLHDNRSPIQLKIDTISAGAYERLQAAAPSQSKGYRRFVRKIPNHKFLLDRGLATFKNFLRPDCEDALASMSLLDIYSMLHFAYSISMAESPHPTDCTPAEFCCGIGTFRNILNNTTPEDGSENEVRIFDEIVNVMWSELKYGIAWIGKKTGWNWQYMFNMSTKMRDIDIARQLLKRAAENDGNLSIDPDPDPTCKDNPEEAPTDPRTGDEPSFIREITIRKAGGESFIEIRMERHEQLASPLERQRRPPDKSTWWEVVTGTTFLMVIAGLQEIQAANPAFGYLPTNMAYSCLCYPDPTNDTSIPPHYREYVPVFHKQVFARILEGYMNHAQLSPQSETIVKMALELVKRSLIHTLRHFEDYVIGMARLFQWTREQHAVFLNTLLNICWSCSREIFADMMPCKIRSEYESAYSIEYIRRRIEEEGDEGYSSPEASYHAEDHSTNNDADAMDIDSNDHPNANDHVMKDVANEPRQRPAGMLHLGSESSASRKRTCNQEKSGRKQSSPPCSPKKSRQLFCTVSECSFKKPFSSQSNLNRHNKAYHSPSRRQEGFPCPECGEKFSRRDNVGKHRDMVHGIPRKTKKRRRI